MTKIFQFKNKKDEDEYTFGVEINLPTFVTVPLIVFLIWLVFFRS